jgi:hypothetical protein
MGPPSFRCYLFRNGQWKGFDSNKMFDNALEEVKSHFRMHPGDDPVAFRELARMYTDVVVQIYQSINKSTLVEIDFDSDRQASTKAIYKIVDLTVGEHKP